MPELAGIQVTTQLAITLVPVLLATLVAILLWTVKVPITKGVMMAMVPWAITGAAVHTLYTTGAYDRWAETFFDPVSVYFTMFTVAGLVWAMMDLGSRVSGETAHDAQYLAAAGTGAALATGAAALSGASGSGIAKTFPAFGGLVAAVVVAALAYVAVNVVYSKPLINTGSLGYVLVFGQTLDATMAALALELFGQRPNYQFGRNVVSTARDVSVVASVGPGWALLFVKILLAMVAVSIFGHLLSRSWFRERPEPVYLLMGALTVYGIGPGMHHFFTMVVGG